MRKITAPVIGFKYRPGKDSPERLCFFAVCADGREGEFCMNNSELQKCVDVILPKDEATASSLVCDELPETVPR